MSFDYFDIHSHLNFPQYDIDRDVLIQKLKDEDIGTITIGVDLETSKQAVALADLHDNLYATIGVHPDDDPKAGFNALDYLSLAAHPKVVAIGECGLDYARLPEDPAEARALKQKQKEMFERQIEFAIENNKPLMIHCRQAYPDALDILSSKKNEHGDKLQANFHFFTEPVEVAKKILELGFTVSVTGVITFVKQYAEIVSYVPLESMMSETDAPFVAPIPHRGKRNEPAFVRHVVEKIAEIKKISVEEVKIKLVENVQRNFGIK